ncbi:MAG: PDDEXK nuclease domain-containing protein [Sumerlaeia bacterium]
MRLENLAKAIGSIHGNAQSRAGLAVNRVLNWRNWLIGAYIIEFEQGGEDRAEYGEGMLKELAKRLKDQGASGLSWRNLYNCRLFASCYSNPQILQTASAKLGEEISQTLSGLLEGEKSQTASDLSAGDEISQTASAKSGELPGLVHFPSLQQRDTELEWRDGEWTARLFGSLSFSHLLELARIDEPLKRAFYELECLKSGWSVRELKRQRNSGLYERVGLSKDKDAVMALAKEGRLVDSPATILRDPYVLEFTGLEQKAAYSESDLETALLNDLEAFLLELGRDFCFMDRQMRITVAGKHRYLDLLFFHRELRCLVAIDLKIGEFEHENAGQMNFYLNYLKENVAKEGENPPVGILLCADKDAEEVHYATAGLDNSVFVSRYLVALPSEEQLMAFLRREQEFLSRLRTKEGEE